MYHPFFGELLQGKRPIGAPKKRYKDVLKASLKRVKINTRSWQTDALHRSSWRAKCRMAVVVFEEVKIDALKAKRARKKQ